MEHILARIQRAYYDNLISNHQKFTTLTIIKEVIANKNPTINKQYMFILNKICNIQIDYDNGTFLSFTLLSTVPALINDQPRNMFDIAMDNILFNVDFNGIENSVGVLQNIRDLFVAPLKDVALLDDTRRLLEENNIFWTGTRFSLLPDREHLIRHYFDILPKNLKLECIELYVFELTNVNSTVKKLRYAVNKLQLLTRHYWKSSDNRDISDLLSENWIYSYIINYADPQCLPRILPLQSKN
jgi:hypothetical protein